MARVGNQFRWSDSARRTPGRGRHGSVHPRACATPQASLASSRDLQCRLARHCLERVVWGTDTRVAGRDGSQIHLLILECADASREREQPNEAGSVALLVDVVFTEGDEALVVERKFALAADDRCRALE